MKSRSGHLQAWKRAAHWHSRNCNCDDCPADGLQAGCSPLGRAHGRRTRRIREAADMTGSFAGPHSNSSSCSQYTQALQSSRLQSSSGAMWACAVRSRIQAKTEDGAARCWADRDRVGGACARPGIWHQSRNTLLQPALSYLSLSLCNTRICPKSRPSSIDSAPGFSIRPRSESGEMAPVQSLQAARPLADADSRLSGCQTCHISRSGGAETGDLPARI